MIFLNPRTVQNTIHYTRMWYIPQYLYFDIVNVNDIPCTIFMRWKNESGVENTINFQ